MVRLVVSDKEPGTMLLMRYCLISWVYLSKDLRSG